MAASPKIYFACSIRAGREQAHKYPVLVGAIKEAGGLVLSEVSADGHLTAAGSAGNSKDIWKRDISWVNEADALIAEVTNPSLGVGYEIREAETLSKPVLALFEALDGRKLSAMIDGAPGVEVCEYKDIEVACEAIKKFISKLES